MKIIFQKSFEKQYKKLPKKIREQFNMRLALFLNDQQDSLLNVHMLKGEHEGLLSLNVTGDIRAVFDTQHKNIIIFVAIGSHSELYS